MIARLFFFLARRCPVCQDLGQAVFRLGQVHRHIVVEPAVPGPEALGLAVWASHMTPCLLGDVLKSAVSPLYGCSRLWRWGQVGPLFPGAVDGGVLEEPEASVPDVARPDGVDQEFQAAEDSLPDEVQEWLRLVSTGVRVLEERYGSLDVEWVLRGSGRGFARCSGRFLSLGESRSLKVVRPDGGGRRVSAAAPFETN